MHAALPYLRPKATPAASCMGAVWCAVVCRVAHGACARSPRGHGRETRAARAAAAPPDGFVHLRPPRCPWGCGLFVGPR